MTPHDTFIDIGFDMHIRRWHGSATDVNQTQFLLVHGLSSNAQTWDEVAVILARAGHSVVAVDQRGHGRSDKPPVASGYDFDTITADLLRVIAALGWERPIVVGQSWGGNVVLALGALHPGTASGLIFVDGGFLDVKQRAPKWEDAYELFKPPQLHDLTPAQMATRLRQFQPEWSEAGIRATMANFETLADGTIQPWLTLDRHMAIFRAMWEQDPQALYPLVREPVLICPAGDKSQDDKRAFVQQATAGIAETEVIWFPHTSHDIHVHRPRELAGLFLDRVQRMR